MESFQQTKLPVSESAQGKPAFTDSHSRARGGLFKLMFCLRLFTLHAFWGLAVFDIFNRNLVQEKLIYWSEKLIQKLEYFKVSNLFLINPYKLFKFQTEENVIHLFAPLFSSFLIIETAGVCNCITSMFLSLLSYLFRLAPTFIFSSDDF